MRAGKSKKQPNTEKAATTARENCSAFQLTCSKENRSFMVRRSMFVVWLVAVMSVGKAFVFTGTALQVSSRVMLPTTPVAGTFRGSSCPRECACRKEDQATRGTIMNGAEQAGLRCHSSALLRLAASGSPQFFRYLFVARIWFGESSELYPTNRDDSMTIRISFRI
jgi:hypothetical protein